MDAYIKHAGLPTRSADDRCAVRFPDLEDHYAEAWAQWSADEHSNHWEDIGQLSSRELASLDGPHRIHLAPTAPVVRGDHVR